MNAIMLVALSTALLAAPVAAQAPKAKAPPSIPEPIMAALKAAAGGKLKDPYSVQFERMTRATRPNVRGEPTDVVCGYFNAKNSYGAFTGARPFIFFVATKDFSFSTGDAADRIIMPEMLKTFCSGLI